MVTSPLEPLLWNPISARAGRGEPPILPNPPPNPPAPPSGPFCIPGQLLRASRAISVPISIIRTADPRGPGPSLLACLHTSPLRRACSARGFHRPLRRVPDSARPGAEGPRPGRRSKCLRCAPKRLAHPLPPPSCPHAPRPPARLPALLAVRWPRSELQGQCRLSGEQSKPGLSSSNWNCPAPGGQGKELQGVHGGLGWGLVPGGVWFPVPRQALGEHLLTGNSWRRPLRLQVPLTSPSVHPGALHSQAATPRYPPDLSGCPRPAAGRRARLPKFCRCSQPGRVDPGSRGEVRGCYPACTRDHLQAPKHGGRFPKEESSFAHVA